MIEVRDSVGCFLPSSSPHTHAWHLADPTCGVPLPPSCFLLHPSCTPLASSLHLTCACHGPPPAPRPLHLVLCTPHKAFACWLSTHPGPHPYPRVDPHTKR